VTLGAVSAARAEPLPTGSTTILETVDSIEVSSITAGSLRVEGISEGETQPRVFDINFSGSTGAGSQSAADRCLKFLLIAQSHPGRYKIEIVTFNQNTLPNLCRIRSR
jgi:hypothetical protein